LISGLRRARARAGGGHGRPASSRRGGSGVAVSAWRVWAVRGQGSPFFCFFLFFSARRRARGSQSPDHDCGGRRGGVKHQIQTACAMRLDVARRRIACTCEPSQTCDGLVTAGAGTSYRCSRPSPSWRIKMHEERKSRDTHQTQKNKKNGHTRWRSPRLWVAAHTVTPFAEDVRPGHPRPPVRGLLVGVRRVDNEGWAIAARHARAPHAQRVEVRPRVIFRDGFAPRGVAFAESASIADISPQLAPCRTVG